VFDVLSESQLGWPETAGPFGSASAEEIYLVTKVFKSVFKKYPLERDLKTTHVPAR
jgi:hypothetical protein